jgi:hypothetical protein
MAQGRRFHDGEIAAWLASAAASRVWGGDPGGNPFPIPDDLAVAEQRRQLAKSEWHRRMQFGLFGKRVD